MQSPNKAELIPISFVVLVIIIRTSQQLTGINIIVQTDPPHQVKVFESVEFRQSGGTIGPSLFELCSFAGTDGESCCKIMCDNEKRTAPMREKKQ